ncbi:MAG: glycosyltransferase family 1 protein [Clostridiaceae bacterium]|nr:glycosyltransferase family 1 protein [Clostridiaceae bacterium]
MHILGKIKVTTELPEEISKLKDLAYNLWWTWNHEAVKIFSEIDPTLWKKTNKNPVHFLQVVSKSILTEKISDPLFMERYTNVISKFDSYMTQKDTWFARNYPDKTSENIIYFSAEYGLHEILPIYSGGLGVLSGDHCKTASDLGLPFTAVGLLYKQGYFNQRINRDGWQETSFTNLNISELPIQPVLTQDGKPLLIQVEIPNRIVYAKVWRIAIGRINLYAMDTDVPENNQYDKTITFKLYGGDRETRIQQEILLGIGGIRLLDALNIKGTVYHMNEGHSAFIGLELCRKLMAESNLSFEEAREIVSSSSVFTTHTPVPAGNDVFPLDMMDRYFGNYYSQLHLNRDEFMALGLKPGDQYNFNMTVLALNMSGKRNGVSELHGAVSRNIYSSLWPGIPEDDVPILHVTNGIHTKTWLSPEFEQLYNKYLPDNWQDTIYDTKIWEAVDQIPDKEIWDTHCHLKEKMINYVRSLLKKQLRLNGMPAFEADEFVSKMNANAFTIGFARRFATYKRAALIFRNMARIERILNNNEMPVQIIFAGKAHPADRPAHEVIKHIHDIARREGFKGKIFLIENYNMALARHLVQGVDLWLNNPRRPLEASGTSGQKVCINGIPNCSILDGWWCEGYNGKNGWVIGDGTPYENEEQQDDADSKSLYCLLENQIIPMYFKRDVNGIPTEWIKIMKESIKSITPLFSTHRMLLDYTREFYNPCIDRVRRIQQSNYELVRNLSSFKHNIQRFWSDIRIMTDSGGHTLNEHSLKSEENITLNVKVSLGNLSPEDVSVEVYYGQLVNNQLRHGEAVEMNFMKQSDSTTWHYSVNLNITESGEYGYTFRVIPKHKELFNKHGIPFIKWANS